MSLNKALSILVIEDDLNDMNAIKDTLSPSTGSVIYSIDETDNWENANQKLHSKCYDLIIADVNVYKDESIKENGGSGEYCCLDDLLKFTESRCPPIPVIVYTGTTTLESLKAKQNLIADFWEKPLQLAKKFYEFRVRKILELQEREQPNPTLMRCVRIKLEILGQTEQKDIWGDTIIELIDKYENTRLSADRAKAVLIPLRKIANELFFAQAFETGFNNLHRIDLPCSSLLPSVRPHFLHSLNTFLLGYYLFNLCGIDWPELFSHTTWFKNAEAIAQSEIENKQKAHKKILIDINRAWFIASLLHDVGLSAQYYTPLLKEISELVLSLKITNSISEVVSPKLENIDQAIDRMNSAGMDEKTCKFIRERINELSTEDRIDHGLASALFIAKNCYDEANETCGDSNPAILTAFAKAATAVSLHNFIDIESFPELDFSEKPICSMLLFCDAIQAWDRDRVDFGLIGGDRIAKVELTNLASVRSDSGSSIVTATVKYIPHIAVPMTPPLSYMPASNLQKIVQDYVISPLRKKLRCSGSQEAMPRIEVNFRVGQETIADLTWPT